MNTQLSHESLQTLETACRDILEKNMEYTNEQVYFLYDTESPLAKILSDAYKNILPPNAIIREFINPPQPLYRGGLVNPDNPYVQQQNRIATLHNIRENIRVWLDHHTKDNVKISEETSLSQEREELHDPQIESIKNDLISLPKWSIVILAQSANFRLSTFRIRLELFQRGIHVVEHNHLAYISESEFETFIESIRYRTHEYVRKHRVFTELFAEASETRIVSTDGSLLFFGKADKVCGNTGDYSHSENRWGTLPLGEVFTEALDLSSVHGKCLVDTFPRADFSIAVVEPFEMVIENGKVLPSENFPPEFAQIYAMIRDNENNEVCVRELGLGLNPAISSDHHLSDINFHERKVWVHMSLGKKHGIYGKKLPKTEVQRFHIDVFIAISEMYVGDVKVFDGGTWII